MYVKNNQTVFIDPEERFIYEVYVFIWYENIRSLGNHKFFYSKVEIKNIIESYFINKYIEVYTVLHSAPKEWIIENDFILYVKPEKKKRKKNEKIVSN